VVTAPSTATKRTAAWVVFAISALMLAASFPLNALVLKRGFGGDMAFNVMFLSLPVVGILIARRQPGNRIAWILLAIGAVIALGSLTAPDETYAVVMHPGAWPAATVVAAINAPLWVLDIGLTGTYLILLFPDGRLPSPRWRPVAWASGITMGVIYVTILFGSENFDQNPSVHNPLFVHFLAPVLPVVLVAIPVLPLCMLACAVSLALRYRRSRGVERLQVKWLASAAAVVATLYLLSFLISLVYNVSGNPQPRWIDTLSNASVVTFVLIPIAIGVALLKHHLYGIDRLISRTVSYAVITGTLLAVYVGLVTVVSRIAPRSSSLAVAASTLIVAALFQPLRRRVQAVIDRRFNRARYDADRTVEVFTRRLREKVDLDAVRADLLAVVDQTLEPSHAVLWLRPGRGSP
jgi:hypothetical protein